MNQPLSTAEIQAVVEEIRTLSSEFNNLRDKKITMIEHLHTLGDIFVVAYAEGFSVPFNRDPLDGKITVSASRLYFARNNFTDIYSDTAKTEEGEDCEEAREINDEYCWMHSDQPGGGGWTCKTCKKTAKAS